MGDGWWSLEILFFEIGICLGGNLLKKQIFKIRKVRFFGGKKLEIYWLEEGSRIIEMGWGFVVYERKD